MKKNTRSQNITAIPGDEISVKMNKNEDAEVVHDGAWKKIFLFSNIEGFAVTSVLKDTERLDMKALDAFMANNYLGADSFYTAFFKATKDHDPTLGSYLSIIKSSLGQNEDAIKEGKNCLQYHFSNETDYYALCGLGQAYANMNQFELSLAALQTAQNLIPGDGYSKGILGNVKTKMEREKTDKIQR